MRSKILLNYLVGERPDVILNIVDGTNIERNFISQHNRRSLEFLRCCWNMMDIVRKW